jgi:HPt (histidine-containing phosphotransfer) domain-containing protein
MSEPARRPEDGLVERSALEAIRALQSDAAPDLLARVVRLYFESAPDLIARLRAGLEASDYDAVRVAAHTLKSSSANLGATALAELCKQLELAARAGAIGPGVPYAQAIAREYDAVRAALQAEIGEAAT